MHCVLGEASVGEGVLSLRAVSISSPPQASPEETCATQDYVWNVIWRKPELIQTFLQLEFQGPTILKAVLQLYLFLLEDNKLDF